MEKDYYILFNPDDYLTNDEVREIIKKLDKPTFFVMPAYREDGYVIKVLDQTINKGKMLITKTYPSYTQAISKLESLNFNLAEEYYEEEEFLDWQEELNVSFYYEDDYPTDDEIIEKTNSIKKYYGSEMVYILYPLDDSYEFFKIAFVLGSTIFRVETSWLMRDVWNKMPEFHSKVQKIQKQKLIGLQSMTIREGLI